MGGSQCQPVLIAENPNFGRVSACKRVARSLYMGTAPGANHESKGINDQRVKLACVMPGVSRSPSSGMPCAALGAVAATSSRTAIAVLDEPVTRLVLLAAQYTHKHGQETSRPREWAASYLQSKGNSPRHFQNSLVFLALDEQNLDNLFQAIADRRAWQRVIDEKLLQQITYSQANKAASKIEEAPHAIAAQVTETWCRLWVPYQNGPPHWS